MKFKEYKLQDICKVVDSLHKTPSYENKGVPMIRVTDLKDGYFSIPNEVKLVSQEVFSEFSKKHIPEFNDILMSRVGSYGITSIIKTREKFCLGQNTIVITDFSEEVLSEYLFYYLISSYGKELIEKNVSGSTQKTISLKSINNFNILLPEKSYQNEVINILSSFYKKIEVNNKIIANLEEQAQAIFKSWFVDFELFQEGNFVESELGMIPEGWEVKNIKSLMEFETGSEPGAKNYSINKNMRIPFYRVGEMLSETNIFVKKNLLKDRVTSKEDVLVSFDGTVGRVVTGLVGGYSSGIKKITSKVETISSNLIYVLFKSKLIQDIINQNATGTTILHASKSIDYMYIPYNDEIYSNFSLVIDPLINIIRVLKEENKKLAEIRDALLPKLMSGEIDVSNIKIKGEEVKNE